jgi:hypothetical protein
VSEQRISVDIPGLLVKAGLVSTHDLSEAIQVSKRLQIPVSRVLLNSHTFTDEVFRIALDLQILMDEELINLESAVNSLRRVASGKSPPDQVLDEIYSLPKFGRGTKTLDELLRASGIVTSEQIEEALKDCAQTKATLGSALILRGILSAGFFPVILRLQERVIKGKISSEDAIRQLREEYDFWQKAEASQRFASLQAESQMHLQELADKQQKRAPKGSHAPGHIQHPGPQPVPPQVQYIDPNQGNVPTVPYQGQVQHQQAYAPPPVQPAAAPPFGSLHGIMAELEQSPHALSLAKLLNQAGLIEKTDPQTAYRKALADPILITQVFHAAGLIDKGDFENVRRCHEAVVKGELTLEEAARALKLSKEMKLPVEQVLDQENGWTFARAQEAKKKGMITGFFAGCAASILGFGVIMLASKKE